jgi:hypothetical protein
MRQGIFGLLAAVLTPLAAQASEPFSVPPSGVLAPPKPVAALYDDSTLTTGTPVAAKSSAGIRMSAAASQAPKTAAKPAGKRSASAIRSSLDPYVRHSRRPPATLPPGVTAPPPYRPGMAMPPVEPLEPAPVTTSYAPPPRAPAANPGARGFFSSGPATLTANMASPAARVSDPRFVNRGLFTGSIPQAAPAPVYAPQPAAPPMSQGQPIY